MRTTTTATKASWEMFRLILQTREITLVEAERHNHGETTLIYLRIENPSVYSLSCRVVIKSRGPGIFPGYYECGPPLISLENKIKIEPEESFQRCLIFKVAG